MSERRILHTFPKNSIEEVRISLTSFKGQEYLDVRVFYRADDGEFRPTKKGVTINMELIPDLLEGLAKVREALGEEENALP